MTSPEVVLICGSRTWTDRATIEGVVGQLAPDTVVVHGAASGADRLAGEAAERRGLTVRACPADWATHGRAAGPIRNAQMLVEHQPVRVIAFRVPGASPGTDDMVRRAHRARIPVEIVLRAEVL